MDSHLESWLLGTSTYPAKTTRNFAATTSLRARKPFNSRCAAVKEPDLKEMDRSRLSLILLCKKQWNFFGEAEEFRCLSLHRSQISKDL
jgi:hypothetical protein